MKSPEAKEKYRSRIAMSELVNSWFKHRFGLEPLPVRGVERVTCFVLMASVVLNITQFGLKLLA